MRDLDKKILGGQEQARSVTAFRAIVQAVSDFIDGITCNNSDTPVQPDDPPLRSTTKAGFSTSSGQRQQPTRQKPTEEKKRGRKKKNSSEASLNQEGKGSQVYKSEGQTPVDGSGSFGFRIPPVTEWGSAIKPWLDAAGNEFKERFFGGEGWSRPIGPNGRMQPGRPGIIRGIGRP